MKNGILKKISALSLGVAMALGIGVAASQIGHGAVKEARAADKITDYKNIVAGNYYIGATTSSTDYYLSVVHTATADSIAGTAVTSKASASVFTFAGSGTTWTIKFADNDYYLGLKSTKDNGKVQVLENSANFTASNQSSKIRLSIGSYSIQKNNSGTQFGSYGNTQTDLWLLPAESDEPSVSFTDPTTSVEVGKTVTNVATGNNLGDATISYTSSNGSVATVNSSGVVTGVAVGTATITAKATVKGTDYSDSYTIQVYKVYSYQLIKTVDDLVAGEEYVIGATWSSNNYFISTNQKTNNREGIRLTVTNETVSSVSTLETFILGGETGKWTLSPKSANDTDQVLYACGTDKNYMKTGDYSDVTTKGEFVISISDTGTATLTAVNTDVRNKMGFNYDSATNWIFSCYNAAPGSPTVTGTLNLAIYRLVEVEGFAKTMTDSLDSICDVAEGKTAIGDLQTAWALFALDFEDLSSNDKATLRGTTRSLSGTNVQKAVWLYDYICDKYEESLESGELSDYNFMGRIIEPFEANNNYTIANNSKTVGTYATVVIIVAFASVTALGAFLLLKKKKEQ